MNDVINIYLSDPWQKKIPHPCTVCFFLVLNLFFEFFSFKIFQITQKNVKKQSAHTDLAIFNILSYLCHLKYNVYVYTYSNIHTIS